MGVQKDEPAERIHSASRVILATRRTLFRAFVDPEMLASWRAPEGMTARIERCDPRIGGGYRLVLRGPAGDYEEDILLHELGEDRIVEEVRFGAAAPVAMIRTTSFERVLDGTKVTVTAEKVLPEIEPKAHRDAIAFALRNLARLTE